MLKGRYLAILLVCLILVISGCSSPTAPTDTDENTSNDSNSEEKVLSVMIPNYVNDLEKNQWETVARKFEEANPDIKVVLEPNDVKVESGKLTTLLNSGVTPPDVILMNAGPGRVNVLSDANLIKPLNDLYEKNGWEDQLRPYAYNLVSGGENIFELPHTIDAILFNYNTEVFANAGVTEPPKTKEEFLDALQKVKDSGKIPITVGARTSYAIGWIFGDILEAVAGTKEVEETLYGDGKWNDPEFVEAAELMAEWVEVGYIPQESISIQSSDATALVLSGKAGMVAGGTYFITDIYENGLEDKLTAYMMPSFIEGQTAEPTGGIGLTWVIPTNSEDPDLAELWMNFILEKFAEVVLADETYNLIPASKSAMSIKPAGAILEKAMKDIENGSGYNPSVFIGPETKEAYYQNLQGIIAGLVTPQEAMDNIEAAAQKDREAGYKLN
jgi:raffinose/stachyose/melibiose transport system substrate-binding protein